MSLSVPLDIIQTADIVRRSTSTNIPSAEIGEAISTISTGRLTLMFGVELIGIPASFEKIGWALTDPRLLVEGPPANSIAHKDVNVRGATSSINSSKRLRVE